MTTPAEQLLSDVRVARELPSPSTARFIRQTARVSQSAMARALEVDRTTLARWEAGAMKPRPAQMRRWSDLLAALQREMAS